MSRNTPHIEEPSKMTTTQILSVLALNQRNHHARIDVADVCRMHSRIVDATAGMPDGGPRVLWAQPDRTSLVIRAPQPITIARLPRGYTTAITHRPWPIPDRPGTWVMSAVLNPGRHNHSGGPTRTRPDRRRINEQPLLYSSPQQQADWLDRRIGGATLAGWRITSAVVARGYHHTGRPITVRRLHVRALWQVDDPHEMVDRLTAGVGIDKTWGCGLTVWAPAEQH
jgi:hypothetical protein